MIVFDLRCANAHIFEAWFASGAAFEAQAATGKVRCPICNDDSVTKAAMAPNVPAKGNRSSFPSPAVAKATMRALAAAQSRMLETSEWVGPRFADRARAMHLGEEKQASIHGQASLAEAKALIDEGVPVAALPLPVVPPEASN